MESGSILGEQMQAVDPTSAAIFARIALEEVDFKTMRSRMISNLYLTGDILNIVRPTGGYSLQLCWTTGAVAGKHAIP